MAGAYVCCRLHPQTNRKETGAGRVDPLQREAFLLSAAPDLVLREQAIVIGTTARVASRLIAVRMPEAVGNARRRTARKNAKNKGSTPSPAHLPR